MKQLTALLVFLVLHQWTAAQLQVTGTLVDEKGKAQKGINVFLLRPVDSSLLRSALSNANGEFTLENNLPGNYLFLASGTGWEKKYQSLQLTDKSLDLGKLVLQPQVNTLAEVTVTARKPFLEQKADKLVVNVENSATAAGATALEILQKVPGVIVSGDKISLAGRPNVTILVDGKNTQYTDINQVLSTMGAANIEKMEVMANPGARYDAQGGSIINIILKRNANLGTNGSVTVATAMGLYQKGQYGVDRNYYRFIPAVNLNHRQGKWNTYGSANFVQRNFFDYSEFDRLIVPYRFQQTNYSPQDRQALNYRAGLDYYANKKNTFGFLFRGFQVKGRGETENTTVQTLAATGQVLSRFKTDNNQDIRRNNAAVNLNWKHVFDTSEHYLNIDADYSRFGLNNSNEIINYLQNGTSYVNRQFIDNPVQLLVLKADYVKPFASNRLLEAGLKSSWANIDNDLRFIGNGIEDPKRSTNFQYKENINAAYLNFKQGFGTQWELVTGLRTEQTVAKGKSQGQSVLNRNYWQLFPSVYLTRKINKDLSTVLQYTRRVNRPSFQQQNPFIEFLDSLTYTRGNPLLRPETSNQYKIGLNYQNQPFFSVSYNQTLDVIFENAPQQEGNLTFTTPQNLARYDNLVFELNFPLNIGKKISGFGGNQFIYNHYKADYLGTLYERQKWNWQAYWQVAYKPRADWSIELSGFYTTNFLSEFVTIRELGNLNIAIQKTFWQKRGRITLNLNDVFFTQRSDGELKYQAIDLSFRQRNETRNARFSFFYSFGNQQLRAARNRSVGSDAETGRVKTN